MRCPCRCQHAAAAIASAIAVPSARKSTHAAYTLWKCRKTWYLTRFSLRTGGGGAPVGEHEVRARLRLEGLFVLASLAATDCVCDATASPNPPERLCSFLGLLTPPRHAPRVGKARVGAGVVMSQRASMTGGLTRMRRMARMVQKVQNLVFCSLVLRTYHTLSGPRPLPPPTRPL